jgi:Nucleotidyl transferase AbiEii toxin, Type IV TA system
LLDPGCLFNDLPASGLRLLFKGGTSLSKAFGLISRFSEDIDITVFRDDIGEAASVEMLETLSVKKRQAKLDAIKQACHEYIGGAFMEQLTAHFRAMLERAHIEQPQKAELDLDDASRQSLLLWYPSVLAETDGYIRPAIKIESGAKSALDPNNAQTISPYVADDVPALKLAVPNVVTV